MNTTTMDLERMSRVFHALSDETRLQIIRALTHGECCVCELQGVLGAYQSRLSFHLKKLKEAGIITGRKEGRWMYYALRPEVWEDIRRFIGAAEMGELVGRAEGCCG